MAHTFKIGDRVLSTGNNAFEYEVTQLKPLRVKPVAYTDGSPYTPFDGDDSQKVQDISILYRASAAKPTEAAERKSKPLATGVLDYFPLALEAVAVCSRVGNEQHNPGQPLHWAKDKSTDHADALLRHLIDRGSVDTDGVLHSAKVAWRALALLQTELEKAGSK